MATAHAVFLSVASSIHTRCTLSVAYTAQVIQFWQLRGLNDSVDMEKLVDSIKLASELASAKTGIGKLFGEHVDKFNDVQNGIASQT